MGSARWKEYQWWRKSEILIPSSKSEWLTAEPLDLEAPRTTLGIAAVAAIPDIVGAAVSLGWHFAAGACSCHSITGRPSFRVVDRHDEPHHSLLLRQRLLLVSG